MIPFEKARAIVLEQARRLPAVSLPLLEAAGRFMAEDFRAPFAAPRFDNSAMDGFAVRARDVQSASSATPVTLRLIATVRAGAESAHAVQPGTTVKVMTGAPLPDGADAVVMREYCSENGDTVHVQRSVREGENVRRAGIEFRSGQVILDAGSQLTPPALGLLASFGMTVVAVHATPRVIVISTGDELVPPGAPLTRAGIYDSNSTALVAACRALGVMDVRYSRVADEPAAVVRELASALSAADVVVSVGGVSAGDFDFVRDAFPAAGAAIHFTSVAMKPGKPNVFATAGDRLVFGLPGNPVSALVSFHHFVRPAVLTMMGMRKVAPRFVDALLVRSLTKKPGRIEFVRARLSNRNGSLMVEPAGAQESHMLSGLCGTDGLIHFPAEKERLAEGETVTVELLTW